MGLFVFFSPVRQLAALTEKLTSRMLDPIGLDDPHGWRIRRGCCGCSSQRCSDRHLRFPRRSLRLGMPAISGKCPGATRHWHSARMQFNHPPRLNLLQSCKQRVYAASTLHSLHHQITPRESLEHVPAPQVRLEPAALGRREVRVDDANTSGQGAVTSRELVEGDARHAAARRAGVDNVGLHAARAPASAGAQR